MKCNKCARLVKSRKNIVTYTGADQPIIIFIDNVPGYRDDKEGKPFVGPPGKFFRKAIAKAGITCELGFCYTVMCRPPSYTVPTNDEKRNCRPYLIQILDERMPSIIVTVGTAATSDIFGKTGIMRVSGNAEIRDRCIYFPLIHPAAALRNRDIMNRFLIDVEKLKKLVDSIDTLL